MSVEFDELSRGCICVYLNEVYQGDILRLEDGFKVQFESSGDCFNSEELEQIVAKLKELNGEETV